MPCEEAGFWEKRKSGLVKEKKQKLFKCSGIAWRSGYYPGQVIKADSFKSFILKGYLRTSSLKFHLFLRTEFLKDYY